MLLPILESAESGGRFAELLKSRECRIHARFTIAESERFAASQETATILWPEVDFEGKQEVPGAPQTSR